MKKKLIALFAACSMIVTAFAGLVQTAYAADQGVRVEVSDGAADDQKVLNFYYEGVEGLSAFMGKLSFTGGTVTIDSYDFTVTIDNGNANKTNGEIWLSNADFENHGACSADGKFATASITIPTDVDITVNFEVTQFGDGDTWDEYNVDNVSLLIPKKAAPVPVTVPAAVTAVEKQNTDAITGTGEYESQTADIYGVEITPNDESVSGATITVGEKTKDINFKTVYSGEGTVVFAVILASETGAALPALSADNVTPIVVAVD